MAFFDQVSGQLADVGRQQSDLRRAVDSGELWMEAGVAEAAAARCQRTVDEINDWLNKADRLADRRKFGNNEDGNRAADRFGRAGEEIYVVMENARTVFQKMKATYLAAGRTAAEADAAGAQSFRSSSE
jgi:hypothetical protein